MKLLDRYIIKKFLGTFFFSITLIISISIVFDFSENLDGFIEKDAPVKAIVFDYYLNFIPYFINLFSPLFIFIAVIFFTSKMASNTEIISILASGISFRRFLVPYVISAIFLGLISFYLNSFLIPKSNQKRLEFKYTYIKNPTQNRDRNIHLQIDPNSYIYVGSYSNQTDVGIKFTIEQFDENNELKYKLLADFIKWDTVKNLWTIQNYYERRIDGINESIKRGLTKDTVLNMLPQEFKKRETDAEMLNFFELNEEIEKEKFKGSKKVVFYEIEKHQRIAFPFASIILTLMGASIASRKVRGGIGIHLGQGLGLSFSYVLFMKVAQTFATNGGIDPMISMWIPNMVFALLTVWLLSRAQK